MTLSNDDAHCEGIILERRNIHFCPKRSTCLRYTEAMRKQAAPTDTPIPFMTAIDRCDQYHELN